MIETIKDIGKHSHRGGDTYDTLTLERTASQILHHMEDSSSDTSLSALRARVLSNALTIYGPTRQLDIITYAATSSRQITAAIVEHNPTGRTYVHCSSAKEDSRLAACEHLLVITEDILQRLMDAHGISSSGWLPATAAAQQAAVQERAAQANEAARQHAAIEAGSMAGSMPGSRRSSVQPPEGSMPHSYGHSMVRSQSDIMRRASFPDNSNPQIPGLTPVPRTSSDIIHAPKPMPVGRFAGHGRVQWKMGSEES